MATDSSHVNFHFLILFCKLSMEKSYVHEYNNLCARSTLAEKVCLQALLLSRCLNFSCILLTSIFNIVSRANWKNSFSNCARLWTCAAILIVFEKLTRACRPFAVNSKGA